MAFLGPIGRFLFEEEEPTLDMIQLGASIGILGHGKDIAKEKQLKLYKTSFEYIERQLRSLSYDPFIKECEDIILTALCLETVAQFVENSFTKDSFDEQVGEYFQKTIKYLLANYYENLQKASQFDVQCDKKENNKVEFWVSGHKKSYASKIVDLGEPFTYEEYSYTLNRITDINRIALSIKNKIKPNSLISYEVDEKLDIAGLYNEISDEENNDWKNALAKITMEYRSI